MFQTTTLGFSQKFVQNLSAKWSLDDQPWSNWCRGLSEKLLYSFTLLFFKDCLCDDKKKAILLQGMKNVLDLSVRGVEGEVSVFIFGLADKDKSFVLALL